jgi:hypothetical protein
MESYEPSLCGRDITPARAGWRIIAYRCKASLIGEFARQLGTKVAEATGSSRWPRSSASARRRLPALTTPGLPGAPRTFPRIQGVPSLLPANSAPAWVRVAFDQQRRSATMARRSSE